MPDGSFDPERVVALRRIRDVVFRRPVRIGDTIHHQFYRTCPPDLMLVVYTLNLGAITRNPYSALNVVSTGTITSTTGTASTVLTDAATGAAYATDFYSARGQLAWANASDEAGRQVTR